MRKVPRILCVMLMLAPAMVAADDIEEITVTATRAPRAVSEVSSAVTLVGSGELSRISPGISADALRGRSGVFVQQTTPGQGIPIVRGLKGSEVLHLVDGFRLNNALFRNAPNQYVALVDPFLLSRVEVVRGPSSALYGSDAMGGVVQFLTDTGELAGDRWHNSGRLLARFESADLSQSARAEWFGGHRTLSAAAGVSWQDVDDLRAGGGVEQAPSGYRSQAANARLQWSRDDSDWLLDAQYLTQPETQRYDELVAGFGQSAPASAVFAFEPNSRLFLHSRYRRADPFPWMTHIEVHAGFQRVTDDRRNRDTGADEERRERNASDLFGVSAQGVSRVADRHTLTYGAELYFDEVSSRRTGTDINTGIERALSSRFPDGSTMDSLALYLNDEFAVTGRLSVTAGGRFSLFRTDMPAADRGVGASVDVDDLTGNLGLSYALTPRVHLTGNIGRGFRPPNIFDLGTLGPRPGNRFNTPNPNLGPESVLTADIGIKFAGERLDLEVFAFGSDYDEKITSVLTGEIDEAGREIVQSRNTNSVELSGVETGMRYRFDGGWRFAAAFSTMRGDETAPDGTRQPADRIPPANGRLELACDPGGAWWTEAWIRAAARQDELSDRDASDSRIDPNGTAGWTTLNLRGGYTPRPGLSIQVRVDNLLDKRYREHGSGIDAPGRNFALTVETRF